MRNVAMVLLVGGLLMGASRCGRDQLGGGQDGGVSEGGGSAGRPGGGGQPVECGPTTCARGQVCCNESCGICTPPGGFCTQQFCGDPDPGPEPMPPSGPSCGGIAGIPCAGAATCVDDPSDDCDPENGGADCGGVCVCNALGLCIDGQVWNDSPEVCGCEPDGSGGSGGSGGDGEPCGNVTCPAGQECCNESCGICVPPGGSCTEQFCGDPDPNPEPTGVPCGPTTCAAGQECCNESCGICVSPGGACDQQFCGDPDPNPPRQFCGGFAGFPCPGAGECVDDPSDDCDPQNGGADCGGLCTCEVQGLCARDQVWNDSPEVCACEPSSGGGAQCGNKTCPVDQVCCNASCGICTPKGGACIQIACL